MVFHKVLYQSYYFSIFIISDTFYDIDNCDIASYADDNTPYTSDFNLEEVIQKLELITNNSLESLAQSHESQREKCHLLETRM